MAIININLLPWREELKEQKKWEFISIVGGIIAVASGLILFIHIAIDRQIALQNKDNEFLKKDIKILDQQLEQIKLLDEEKQQLLAKNQIIQTLQVRRSEVVRLFDGIVRVTPSGLYYTCLTRVENRIQIDGKAESNAQISTLMRNIDASTGLIDPRLNLIQADDQKKDDKNVDMMMGFSLQATEAVAPNVA